MAKSVRICKFTTVFLFLCVCVLWILLWSSFYILLVSSKLLCWIKSVTYIYLMSLCHNLNWKISSAHILSSLRSKKEKNNMEWIGDFKYMCINMLQFCSSYVVLWTRMIREKTDFSYLLFLKFKTCKTLLWNGGL